MLRNRLFLSISFSVFIFSISLAQDYDIVFKGFYTPVEKTVDTRIIETRFIESLTDSTNLHTIFETTLSDTFEVTTKYKAELGVGQRFNLFNDLDIRGSLSLEYSAFETSTRTDFLESREISQEILPASDLELETGSSDCIVFLNSFSDFPDVNTSPEIEMLNLGLGVDFIHPLFIPRLNIGLGMKMATPIYTRNSRDFVILERHPVEGGFECEFVLNELKDNSGDGFRNLKAEWTAFLEYQMFDKIIMQLGYSQSLSNVFTSAPNPFFTGELREDKYLPKQVYLGFGYFFNRKINMDAPEPIEEEF